MIQIRSLSKVFTDKNGTFNALKNINLDIKKGDIYGIIGLSGAGKSTLIRCINRLEEPTSGNILLHKNLNKVLNTLINIARSLPFIILMIAVFPLTKLLVGTRIGTTAAIVPLTIAAIPFVARLVEGSVKELPWGVVEAALSSIV